MQKINITKARRLYNSGTTIYIVPCKVYPNFHNPWVKPYAINKSDVEKEYSGYSDLIQLYDFDSRVNSYSFYNCVHELGKYPHFYIGEV